MEDINTVIELFDDEELEAIKQLLGSEFDKIKTLPLKLNTASNSGIGVETYGEYN